MNTQSLLIYWRALQSKPGLKTGETIPRIVIQLPAKPADRHLYDGLRSTWELPDYGILPPAFPAVATFMTHLNLLSDRKFPFQAMGTVLIRAKINQTRALRVEEVLSYKCWVEGHRNVDHGIEFDVTTEAFSGDVLVSRTILTMFRRERLQNRDPVRNPHHVHNHLGAHDLSWDVDSAIARHYAKLSGDINPIHLSDATARLLGFKSIVLHGMWTLGRACAMHPVLMMDDDIQIEAEFKRPVLLPASLRYRWWQEGESLYMRVLDQNAVRPHMMAHLTSRSKVLDS